MTSVSCSGSSKIIANSHCSERLANGDRCAVAEPIADPIRRQSAAPPIKTSVNSDKKGADVPGLPNRRFA
jgi:hypothetical protein